MHFANLVIIKSDEDVMLQVEQAMGPVGARR